MCLFVEMPSSSSYSSSSDSSSEEEEEPINSIINEEIKVPEPILFSELVWDVACHPKKNCVAGCSVSGEVKIYSYSTEGPNHELMTLNHHRKSCRAVKFSSEGDILFTASKDKSIQVVDMETGSVSSKIAKAHDSPIYTIFPVDQYLLASGDDDGEVKVWDFRRQTPIMALKECEEYITSFALSKDKRLLLATSGEGTLSAFSIRSRKMDLQSELFDSEFLSCAIVKDETKAIVGSGDGALNIFNWGEWGNISDRFPGHPESIGCMLAIDDDIVCTGSEDGKIRAVQLFPNRFLGIVGTHNGYSVENMSISSDGALLASCSHDQQIKFWDLTCLENLKTDDTVKTNKKDKNRILNSKDDNFFAGLA